MLEAFLKGLGLGLILILSVGPVVFTVLKQSINNGKEGGFAFIAGVWTSDFLLVTLSNIFSELVTTVLEYKQVIGYIGSLFLMGMGAYYIFFKKVAISKDSTSRLLRFSKSDFFKIALSGFFINTLNPGIILFWLVNATAFAVTHTVKERILIFSVCLSINILADIGKVLMADKLAPRLTVHNISIINKLSGIILAAFGLALLWGAFFLYGH